MLGFIQIIRASTKHKKWQFSSKKNFFSFWVIFKKKTALSTFTTLQESSSGKWAHILLVKCLSCYIVVEIFVISMLFNVFSLNTGWSRFLLQVFIWIWIDDLNKQSGIKNSFPQYSLAKPTDSYWFKMSCLSCLVFICPLLFP